MTTNLEGSQQWRNYGRRWRQSPPCAPRKGAPRCVLTAIFLFCLITKFCHVFGVNLFCIECKNPKRIFILYDTYSVPSTTLKWKPPTKSLSPHQSPRYHKTRYFSRHLAYTANDTALNTLRPIRPCFTASNKTHNPPTPHFHYANIAYMALSLVMGYAIHTQFSRIWFSVLQNASTSVYGCVFSNDVCRAPNSWNQRHGFISG